MSKIKLNAASGGGSVAFEGPASSGNDKVIKFPAAPGVIVQVQTMSTNSRTNRGNNTGTFYTTGLTLSITPTSTSNRILVLASGDYFLNDSTQGAMAVYRGGSNITNGTYGATYFHNYSGSNFVGSFSIHLVDSPSTTSATTYAIYLARTGGSHSIMMPANDGHNLAHLTLMEVAG